MTDLTFYFSVCSFFFIAFKFFPFNSLVLKLLEHRGTNRPVVVTINN